MALYRVLLADDEEEIRNGIIRKIDWEKNGFKLVAAAENGREALELAEKYRPDIIMTDIKMPFMSGLELGKVIAENMPNTKIIFFSGFDDFEYAQQAIKLKAMEYILKPVNSNELLLLLKRIKTQLDIEFNEKRDIETLQNNYKKSLPILREQFLVRLVNGKILKKRIDELSQQYELCVKSNFWSVAIIHADTIKDLAKDEGFTFNDKEELIPLSVKNITDENIAEEFKFFSFIYDENVVVIVLLDNKNDILSFIDLLNRICKIAKRYLELSISAGIGSVCDDITNLKYSYHGAVNALGYRVILGDKALYIDDMEPDFTKELQFDEDDSAELLNAIKFETCEEINHVVEKLIGRLKDYRLPFKNYQIYLTEMLSELFKIVRMYRLDMAQVFGEDFKGYSHISDFDSLNEMGEWLYRVCVNISGLIKRERMDSAKLLAEKTKEFVNEHYSDINVSVEMLCQYLHVSPAYFSTVFKRETGISFITYLTNVRMDQAVKLLETTEDKTYIISLKVGYIEPNYFSYVFKKHFGISPSKYRINRGIK